MNANRREFLKVAASGAVVATQSAHAGDGRVEVKETCPTALIQPTADDFQKGGVLMRQVPLNPLNMAKDGTLTDAPPDGWQDRFGVGKGPCGIAKEWGPSMPHGADAAEFLDDDDPNPASARLVKNLVHEFGQNPETGQPARPVEYYQMGISPGSAHILTESQREAISGDKQTMTRFLGYHAWGGTPSTPGPMFQARVGRPMVVRFINQVNDYMSVHLHGSHGPAHSDGHPTFVIPKEYEHSGKDPVLKYGSNHRDYFYPHTVPAKPGVARPVNEGAPGTQKAGDLLDYTESPSTMWYHDHSMDITAPHAYLGLAGFFPAFDDLELRLLGGHVLPFCAHKNKPVGSLLDAHHRSAGNGDDKDALNAVFEAQKTNPLDLCVVFGDKCFSKSGDVTGLEPNQLLYSAKGHNGHLGHAVLVNGMLCPHTYVLPRKLRLRMLNGSNARIYKMALHARLEKSDGSAAEGTDGSLIPLRKKMDALTPEWFRIGADTWLYPHPVSQRKILLSMAKRADTIVDFGAIDREAERIFGRKPAAGEHVAVYLCNLLDQENGRGPKVKLEEADAQEPAAGNDGPIGVPGFAEVNRDDDDHRKAELDHPWPLLKFVIESDLAKHPRHPEGADFQSLGYAKLEEIQDASVTFGTRLRDHHPIRPEDIARTREVLFHRGNGIWQINGRVVDEFVSNFVPELNTAECWILENGGGGWWHPIHIHLESHQLIDYLEESGPDEVRLALGRILARHEQALNDERALGHSSEATLLESILATLRQSLAPVPAPEGLGPVDGNDEPSLQSITRISMKELADHGARRLAALARPPAEARLHAIWQRLLEAYSGIGRMLQDYDAGLVFEDHRIWRRATVPEWDRYKSDTTVLGPRTRAKIFMHFRTFDGPFVFHCHNLEHEDMRMMFVVDPRPTPPAVSAAADAAPDPGLKKRVKDGFHMREQTVAYRHPWRFIEPDKKTSDARPGPDFDYRPHADTLTPKVEKDPPWNTPPPQNQGTPRAHPIWGGWDQHL
jgi:FtsP/CotA-like multicopper oxidase with cupredoxin domain